MNEAELYNWFISFPVVGWGDLPKIIRCGFIPIKGEPYSKNLTVIKQEYIEELGNFYFIVPGFRPVFKEIEAVPVIINGHRQ